MMKISIIIPIYNVQDYIERCINSVISQESNDFELECILVDDCSSDHSMEIAQKIICNYTGSIKFVFLSHDHNRGASAARNTGIEAAVGDFIFFVDSDDRLENGSLKYLVDGLNVQQSPQSIDVIMGNMQLCMDGKPASDMDQIILYDNSEGEALRKILTREIYHTPCNKLVRCSVLRENKAYFEEGIIDEDLLWSYFVFLYSRNVLVMPQITYIYEDIPGSVMHTTSKRLAQLIRSRIVIVNRIMDVPPSFSCPEYYTYLFYVLARAVNLYEMNRNDFADVKEDLNLTKLRLMNETRRQGYSLLYAFFYTMTPPLYYITKFRFYRRYFDRILRQLAIWENFLLNNTSKSPNKEL